MLLNFADAMPLAAGSCRRLHWLLGDQLSLADLYATGFDAVQDWVVMIEAKAESTYVWSSKPRSLMFLSAMRHFAAELVAAGIRVLYQSLDGDAHSGNLIAEAKRAIGLLSPQSLHVIEPGEWRLRAAIGEIADVPVQFHDDPHFLCSHAQFAAHAKGRKQLRMEFFYREMRVREQVLMAADGKTPLGGAWNFDHDNRGSFDARGPGFLPAPITVRPDAITDAARVAIESVLPDHPGQLDDFAWPVTRADALQALDRFIEQRLPMFGQYQDAMWTGEAWLYHSHLSAALNLKLLNPREVIRAAEAAYQRGQAPLASVEGFIRQILGWREYVRGIYWRLMPDYLERNALQAREALPEWYWTGQVSMRCLSDVITQTLRTGYAHHIQRLMITGLYALLLGVDPKAVHAWYLAVYVDAIEWVELPNTLGMSQYADGGVMASKPYIASGKYIQRMSNYCTQCPFNPALATGVNACPFTTLYWQFIDRHRDMLAANPRLAMQVRNLDRFSAEQLDAIRARAAKLRAQGGQP